MIQKKLEGESNQKIADWLQEIHNISISEKQLWNIFRKCIPTALMNMSNKPVFDDDAAALVKEQIKELEKLARMQKERLEAQFYDEVDQMGEKRYNPETGEVSYSATNKYFNESARVYNQTIKNIIELKMSVGLVKKEPEVVEIKRSMDDNTRKDLRNIIMSGLTQSNALDKFVQYNPYQVKRDEYELPEAKIIADGSDVKESDERSTESGEEHESNGDSI